MGVTKGELSGAPTNPLQDSMGDNTRKERRNLLGFSTASLAISIGDLMPTSAFGIWFEAAEHEILLILLLSIVAYFFVMFGIYGWSDWSIAHRMARAEHVENQLRQLEDELFDDGVELANPRKQIDEVLQAQREILRAPIERLDKWISTSLKIRLFVDFILPIVISTSALIAVALRLREVG